MLAARVHVFQDPVFCIGPGAGDEKRTSDTWKKTAEDVIQSNSKKNRDDIDGQPIEIEWHVFPGHTSVHMLQKL